MRRHDRDGRNPQRQMALHRSPKSTAIATTAAAHLASPPIQRSNMITKSQSANRIARFVANRAFISTFVFAAIVTSCGGSTKTSSETIAAVTPKTSDVGQTSPAADNGSGTDASACQLLSESDVTTAMKQPMKVVGGAGAAICAYAATADPSVLLAVQTFATRQDASLDESLKASSDHIDGLGDDAFWNPTLDMVFVRKGERSFAVTSPSLANLTGDPQASKTALVTVARIVLGKF